MIYKPMSSLVQIGFIEPRSTYHIAFLYNNGAQYPNDYASPVHVDILHHILSTSPPGDPVILPDDTVLPEVHCMTRHQLINVAQEHGVPFTMPTNVEKLRAGIMEHFALGGCASHRSH